MGEQRSLHADPDSRCDPRPEVVGPGNVGAGLVELDSLVHHVETWVTQRETWIRVRSQRLLWRVDQGRIQRRLVDGRPG